jgi:hypothetical protein
MPKLTPIFGGLSVLIFYFVAKEISQNKKISILASLFFAVLPFHVYQTSHAAPLTVGHFFLMLSMYFFLRFRKDNRFIIPLLISTMLLIMSHHLTTFFYLISIIFIVFLENIAQDNWTKSVKNDVMYINITSIFMFLYWGIIAKTVYDSFMSSGFRIAGFRLQSLMIIALFFIIIFLVFYLAKKIRKLCLLSKNLLKKLKEKIRKILKFKIKNKDSEIKKFRKKFLFFILIIDGLIVFFTVFEVPWLSFKFTPFFDLVAQPFIISACIGLTAFRYTFKQKNGYFIGGWIFAVFISLIFALITNNHILLPHRHIEYMMAPLSFFIVYGLGGIFSDPGHIALLSKLRENKDIIVKKTKISQKKRIAHLITVFIIVISLASTTYVSHESLGVAVENITAEDVAVIDWISENLNRNTTIIASDHRLEVLAESEGFNTTDSKTSSLWTAKTSDEYIAELAGIGKNYSRITHIIIDNHMKNNIVHVSRLVFFKMTNETNNESYIKFQNLPFRQIYINETAELDSKTGEPIHWAEVIEVDWNYLEKNYFLIDEYENS